MYMYMQKLIGFHVSSVERLKLYHKPVYRDGNFWWYLILNKDMKLRGNIKKTEIKKRFNKKYVGWGGDKALLYNHHKDYEDAQERERVLNRRCDECFRWSPTGAWVTTK